MHAASQRQMKRKQGNQYFVQCNWQAAAGTALFWHKRTVHALGRPAHSTGRSALTDIQRLVHQPQVHREPIQRLALLLYARRVRERRIHDVQQQMRRERVEPWRLAGRIRERRGRRGVDVRRVLRGRNRGAGRGWECAVGRGRGVRGRRGHLLVEDDHRARGGASGRVDILVLLQRLRSCVTRIEGEDRRPAITQQASYV